MNWTDIDLDLEEDLDRLRQFRLDRLLQGDGWSDPNGRDMYSDFDDDSDEEGDDLDEWLEEAFREIDSNECRCDVGKIFDAAEDLSQLLRKHPHLFPRNHAQVEGFVLPGRKTYGSWSRWVNNSFSVPKEFGNIGRISLGKCSQPRHSCRVLMFDNKQVLIDGARLLFSATESGDWMIYDERSKADFITKGLVGEVLALMDVA